MVRRIVPEAQGHAMHDPASLAQIAGGAGMNAAWNCRAAGRARHRRARAASAAPSPRAGRAQGYRVDRHRDHRGRRRGDRRGARPHRAAAGIALDVNDAPGVEAAVDAIVKADGGLHVLVNNAGITRDTLAMRMKDEDWDAVLDTNLKAVFRAAARGAAHDDEAALRTHRQHHVGRRRAAATPARPTTRRPRPASPA